MEKENATLKLLAELDRRSQTIYPSRAALENLLTSGRKIKLYLGVDPTSPQLHIGHIVPMLTLRAFQEAGHKIIFLIGDFTAQIGDPTDKTAARVALTNAQVKANLKTFKAQAGRIIRFSGPNAATLAFNSKWLRALNFADVLSLMSHVTVQQMIERDMFQDRLAANRPIHLHEFMYPLMQGYDSVAMGVDLELGGNDQTFNMLMGRTLMKALKNKEKFVVSVKLLVNPATGRKMSKTEGALVAFNDSPAEVFGKVMSYPDEMMFEVARLCSQMPTEILSALEEQAKTKSFNPKDAKMEVAYWVATLIHGEKKAKEARDIFVKTFSERDSLASAIDIVISSKQITIQDLVVKTGVAKSNSDAWRLIEQGGFEINGQQLKTPKQELQLKGGELIKVGKRHFFRIVL